MLAALPLTACATDKLALAPAMAEKPWVLPVAPSAAPAEGGILPGNAAPVGNAVTIDPDRDYGLAELIDLAQRGNPETREAWERARQAALAVGLSEAAYLPQISAEVVGGMQVTPLPIPTTLIPQGYFRSTTREVVPTLAAKWLLFDFGKREGEENGVRAGAFIANVAFTGAHQRLIYEVSRDYFALGAARGRLRVARQALATAQAVQDAVDMRRAQGLATVVEQAQARRQTAQARYTLEKTMGAEHAAYAALIASMGVAPSAPLRTRDSTRETLPASPSGDVDQFVRAALANRPDIIAGYGKIRAAEAALDAARARYYPTIGLEAQAYENIGGLSTQGSRFYSITQPGSNVLVKLSVPLFDGGIRDAHVARARSEVAASHAALDRARDQAERQVIDAYDALRTGFAEYSAAKALVDAAQTAYDAAFDAYHHGVGTYIGLLTDETALSQAQSQMEDAHANVFTAAAALAFATGAATGAAPDDPAQGRR